MPNETPPWTLPFILIGFPIFFAAIWTFVCWFLSVLGGWSQLAKRFAATSPPEGQRFSTQIGRIGVANYKSALTIHASPAGLHLAVMPLFRVGHPPLLIPWREIHDVATWKLFFAEMVTFQVGHPRIAKLSLPKKVFDGQPILIDGEAGPAAPPPLR